MQRLPLNKFGEVILDSNGAGYVELKPGYHAETWYVTSASVNVVAPAGVTQPKEPTFKLFSNGVFIAGSDKGDLNSSGLYEVLHTNQPMRGEWTDGDPNAVAQFRLGGVRQIA